MRASVGRSTRREALIGALLFAGTFLVFRSGTAQVLDSNYFMLVSERLVSIGAFHLDDVPGLTAFDHSSDPERKLPYQITQANGHYLHFFPPGTPILSAPLIAVGRVFGQTVYDRAGRHSLRREVRLQRRIACILMAGFSAFVFLAGTAQLPLGWSTAVALSAALGTQVWSTASRGLWTHTWGVFLVGIAVLVLTRAERPGAAPRALVLATALAWACFCRPLFIIPAAAVSGFLFIRDRGAFVRYVLASAFWALGFALFSWYQYQSVLPPYYSAGRLGIQLFGEALVGNLLSPSRGMFVYVPVAIIPLFLCARYWRWMELRGLAVLSGIVITTHWIAISLFPHWWGGWSYGPRLMTDVVPWFALLGIAGTRAMLAAQNASRPGSKPGRAVSGLLLAASIAIHANGAVWEKPFLWNREPEDIDRTPGRLWDWRHPQFLHGLIGE